MFISYSLYLNNSVLSLITHDLKGENRKSNFEMINALKLKLTIKNMNK